MNNHLEILNRLDQDLTDILRRYTADDVKKYVTDLLEEAEKNPGRAAKFRSTYIFERMAEITSDMADAGEDGIYEKLNDVMRWIDAGLMSTAKLLNPESRGQWVANFEQTVVKVRFSNPKDPKQVEAREARAKQVSADLDRMLTRTGGSIIVPGDD